jgi:hypothetical protein
MSQLEGATIHVHHLYPRERAERIFYQSQAISCPSKDCHGYLVRFKGRTGVKCAVCGEIYVLAHVKKGKVGQ